MFRPRFEGVMQSIWAPNTIGGGLPSLSPFDVSKIVFLGASITDQSIASQSTRTYSEGYVVSEYEKSITIVERATAGWTVETLAQNIDSIISEFDSEPGTHYVMHIGGNDVLAYTEFLNLPGATQSKMISDLEYIYDAIHAQGRKLIQSSITFRNYGGTTIDNDPAVKVNELGGSYTYTRDWVVPVMQRKAPEYLYNDWPAVDLYNATRNIYDDWKDGADVVHPNKWARIIYTQEMVDGFLKLSGAEIPQAVTPLNYNEASQSAGAVDVTVGFTAQNASGDNINWLVRDQYAGSTVGDYKLELNDTSGQPTGLRLFTSVNVQWVGGVGNSSDPSNSTATLENNQLLSSYTGISTSGGVSYIMIDGLEPFREYTLQAVASRAAGVEQLNDVYIHGGVPTSVDVGTSSPEGNIVSGTRLSDYKGRLFVAVAENSTENRATVNGVRVFSNG